MRGRVLKKVSFGAGLLAAASALLLLSDVTRRATDRDASSARHAKVWKLYLIEYNNVVDVQESEEGVLEGLRNSGFVEGVGYQIKVVNAQGDMPTVSTLVDSAVSDRADLLIVLSTPTLQAAIRRAPKLPIVFTYVASAVAAGAGRSDQDHLPNVTGITTGAAYGEITEVIHKWFPHVHRLGTLYVPSETNMVFHEANMEKAARQADFDFEVVPVNTATDIADAATALVARGIDAVCQIPGNLTAAGFASISAAARRARIPSFAFQQSQARDGALVVVTRDYRDAGRDAARRAAEIMQGRAPGSMPFRNFEGTKIIVNLDTAAALHIRLPEPLLNSAQELIENGIQRSTGQ